MLFRMLYLSRTQSTSSMLPQSSHQVIRPRPLALWFVGDGKERAASLATATLKLEYLARAACFGARD